MHADVVFWIESLDVVLHSNAVHDIETIWRIRVAGWRVRKGEEGRMWTVPFVEKHASLVALFLPLVAVVVVDTYVAELVEYGENGGVSSANDFHVGHVSRCWRHPERWRWRGGCVVNVSDGERRA